MNMPPTLAIVIPCYNEETILENNLDILNATLLSMEEKGKISTESFLLCINDGSTDGTWDTIRRRSEVPGARIRGISLSRNCGHQMALIAGLQYVSRRSDISISIDADLQDDIDAMEKMVDEYRNGADIVCGVRNDRSSDSAVKRLFAENFYNLMTWMGVKTIYNHADFRLMSRRATLAMLRYKESNLYLRGLVPLLGFNRSIVYYSRKKADRPTHYSICKMFNLAWDGITSFSIYPIHFISFIGILLITSAILYGTISLFFAQLSSYDTAIFVVMIVGGFQMLGCGIVGEYAAKTYIESKRRPRYHIDDEC